ncbi:hypothetical protein [Algivirga pacifica]|uniref:Uncharacterized protein n=1 Tax=Algivirga pacifica TaxID=1162670 RepID=A0ABP9DAG5_9BACT
MEQENIEYEWIQLSSQLQELFGKTPDLKTVLFLIGVQELGKGPQHFTKEEKEDLMHIAVCKVLSIAGFYELKGMDQDGWPIWELKKKLPFLNMLEQETLLKSHVIDYFKQEVFREQDNH